MRINLILIPFIILCGLLLSINDNKKNRIIYIVFCSIVLILVASLRSPEWMTDTYKIDTLNYQRYFENTFDLGWEDIYQRFFLRYYIGEGDFDIGFVAINKLISLITHEFWQYSLILDLLFFVPFGIILYRYSTKMGQIMFAYVFYISLVQIFLLGGSRQIFSLGFDLMALLAIFDKKRLMAILFFVFGITIHFSSLIFALPLIVIWLDVKPDFLKFIHALCFLLFPMVLMFPNEIIQFMGDMVGVEKYANYGSKVIQGGAETFILMIELLSLFFLFAIKRKDMKDNRILRNFYVMIPFFTIFAPLVISNGSMIRISLYYHLFITLLVPYAIDCSFSKQSRSIGYVVAIASLSFLALMGGGIRYYFFWQV